MKDYFKNLLKTQFTIHFFILGIVSIALSFFYFKSLFTYIAFVLIFTAFDVIGFGNMIKIAENENNDLIVIPYRIMQNLFMVALFIVVYLFAGLKCLLACFIGWWCGGCDLLYYILLQVEFGDYDYSWMRGWSVWILITVIKTILGIDKEISRVEFIIVCVCGLIGGGLIAWI